MATNNKKAESKSGFMEFILESLGILRRPLDCVQLEVTSLCAGRCMYCPHTTMAGLWKPQNMSDEVFAASLPLMRRSGRVHLQGWGEPLMHPEFFEFCAQARKAGCRISTTTCGLRLNEATAEKITASGLDLIAFSLAGTTEETNSARKGAPLAEVVASIKTLQAARKKKTAVHLEVYVAYIMLADRMEDVVNLPDFMAELGVHGATVSTLDYMADSGHKSLAIAPDELDKLSAAGGLLKKAAARAEKLGLAFDYTLPASQKRGNCRENILRSVYVAADGSLSPCIYLNTPTEAPDPRRRIFGNVLDKDAFELWNSPEFRAFREGMAGGSIDEACEACPKRFEI